MALANDILKAKSKISQKASAVCVGRQRVRQSSQPRRETSEGETKCTDSLGGKLRWHLTQTGVPRRCQTS